MDLFTPSKSEWTIEEMVAQLGLSHSTVYRYLRSLLSVGLVFSVRPGHYLLGPGIIHYDRLFRLADPLIDAAQPVLRSLASEFDMSGVLFIARIFRSHLMSMLEQRLGLAEFMNSYDRGRFMPLYQGAPPLVILAYMPIRNLKRAFMEAHQASADPLAEWLQFRRELRITRRRGYAIDHGAIDQHAVYISVPLFQMDGGVAGSLTIGMQKRSAALALDSVIQKLRAAAQRIGQQMEAAQMNLQMPNPA
jgi:DNA-binding IclR family transcriptional regulator